MLIRQKRKYELKNRFLEVNIMNERLKARAELFAQNAENIRREYIWTFGQTKRLAALLYALEDKPLNIDALRESHELIKQRTGAFSTLRGNMTMCIAARMSLSESPNALLTDTLNAYDKLKAAGFWASDHLVIAAQQIALYANAGQDQAIVRARAFYDGLRRKHWILTGQDDYIFCAMLGLSDIDVESGLDRLDLLCAELKKEFRWSNSVQAFGELLLFTGETPGTMGRLTELRDKLKDRNLRMDREYTLPSLGVLALLPVDVRLIVEDMAELCNFLREKRGFSGWSVMKQELLVLATALVASDQVYQAKTGMFPVLSTSIVNIVLAQQAAVAAAAASSAAAATASSSS